ncbi:hypothetical protein EJB05_30315, partial [Eragrostis curvula]
MASPSAANLAQLLPTGTVLAYPALAPTFTNHGVCHTAANRWLMAALVAVLAALSLFFSFTDSVIGRDRKLYYGVATPRGFNVFNFSGEEEEKEWTLGVLQKMCIRPVDYVHAVFTVVVFMTVAFSDVGLQKCFFPDASDNTNELLKNLPLGMAFLSSFVFMFPTKRKGIGYNDATPHQKALSGNKSCEEGARKKPKVTKSSSRDSSERVANAAASQPSDAAASSAPPPKVSSSQTTSVKPPISIKAHVMHSLMEMLVDPKGGGQVSNFRRLPKMLLQRVPLVL